MDYNTFLRIFGLNPDNFKPTVSEPFETDTGFSFYLEQRTDINRICPHCNSLNIVVKDYKDIVINCSFSIDKTNELIIKKVRFKCKDCKQTFTPKLDYIDVGAKISNGIKKNIILDCFSRISFSDIAAKYNVSVSTVINIFDDTFNYVERGNMPKILCIDEFHYNKDFEQNYCCIIVDGESKEIVDILRNRRKEYLNEYFSSIDENERENVKYFISDMYDEYGIIKKKYFPNAVHIIDKFHIVSQLTCAIKQRRTKVMKSIRLDEPMLYNFMKQNWQLFERRNNLIPNKTYKNKVTKEEYSYYELLFMCLSLDHDLNAAYEILQDLLTKPFKTEDNNKRIFFYRISERLNNLDDDIFKKVGNTYLKWLDGVVNAYSSDAMVKKLSNSIAENTNNHIKTLMKISYGLNNFERTRKRCILLSRKHQKRR